MKPLFKNVKIEVCIQYRFCEHKYNLVCIIKLMVNFNSSEVY